MSAMLRCAAALAVALSPAGVAGCGGSETGLTSVQQARLQSSISQARQAAKARDRTAVRAALKQFRSDVSALERDGGLSPSSARRMLATAAAALRRAAVEVPAPAPQPPLEAPEGEGEKQEEHKPDTEGKDDKEG